MAPNKMLPESTVAPLASVTTYVYGVVMAAPLLVITNVASPAFAVQAPFTARAGGGGGGTTQVVMSTTVVNEASFGVEKV